MAGPLQGPALDVGTGRGFCAIALAQAGLAVVSVDLDGDEQQLARVLSEMAGVADRIGFVRADASRLPHGDGSFASVAAMDVLHLTVFRT
jgi:2-polyprenyl-3-methyl-5-hydroxy-6-metoxy-1,4-benzoquinol methylase